MCLHPIPPTFRDLEARALQAHRDGVTWQAYWASVADDVRRLHRLVPLAYRAPYLHLLHLWASGDDAGAEPPGSDQGSREA